MGGMIGQVLAARHPDQVRSLVSIMSNTGSRWTGQPALGAYRLFLAEAPDETRGVHRARDEALQQSSARAATCYDEEYIRDVTGRSFDRDHDAVAVGRQLGAVLKTGKRDAMLRTIKAPTLVIHGTEDRLVRPSGGRATQARDPGRAADDDRGHGPRPPPRRLAADHRRHRRERRRERRDVREAQLAA